jgi:diacylglycerol kinase family enzyme
MKDRFGVLAYSLGALQALRVSDVARFSFLLDGQRAQCEAMACVVDNAGNMGIAGFSHGPGISVSDGLFDVFAIRDLRPATLSARRAAARDRAARPEIVQYWRARDIAIVTDPPLPVQADGEMWGTTPITISVLPGAVRVLTKLKPPMRSAATDEARQVRLPAIRRAPPPRSRQRPR